VRNLLRDLGNPEDIVAAAGAEVGEASAIQRATPTGEARGMPTSPWGAIEILAVLGLTVGAFVIPVIGPIVGISLAWASVRWTRREKIVATVLTFLPLVTLILGATGFVSVGGPGPGGPIPVDPVPGIIHGGTS